MCEGGVCRGGVRVKEERDEGGIVWRSVREGCLRDRMHMRKDACVRGDTCVRGDACV